MVRVYLEQGCYLSLNSLEVALAMKAEARIPIA